MQLLSGVVEATGGEGRRWFDHVQEVNALSNALVVVITIAYALTFILNPIILLTRAGGGGAAVSILLSHSQQLLCFNFEFFATLFVLYVSTNCRCSACVTSRVYPSSKALAP